MGPPNGLANLVTIVLGSSPHLVTNSTADCRGKHSGQSASRGISDLMSQSTLNEMTQPEPQAECTRSPLDFSSFLVEVPVFSLSWVFLALAFAAALAFLALAALDPPLPSALEVLAESAGEVAVAAAAFALGLPFPLVFFLAGSNSAPLRVASTDFLSETLFRTSSSPPKIPTLDILAPFMIAFRKPSRKILTILALISFRILRS